MPVNQWKKRLQKAVHLSGSVLQKKTKPLNKKSEVFPCIKRYLGTSVAENLNET